jgi:hypothetical protein
VITITFNDAHFRAGLRLMKERYPQVVRRSLQRGATTGRLAMAQKMAEDTGLGPKATRDQVKIEMRGDFTVALVCSGKRIPLVEFSARWSKKNGVTFNLPGSKARGRLPSAFIATLPGGHRGVFQRRPNAVHKRRPDGQRTQLPIVEEFGPSMPHVFAKYRPLGEQVALEAVNLNLRKEITRLLNRDGGGW